MKELEDKIRSEGIVDNENVLKVGSFLNHQIDVPFIEKCGEEFYRLYKDDNVTKILTIEASGIGVAVLAALYFKVPVVFAKKSQSNNLTNDVYTEPIESFTHGTTYHCMVERRFCSRETASLFSTTSWHAATLCRDSSRWSMPPVRTLSAAALSLKRHTRMAASASGTRASAWNLWRALNP